MVGNIYIRALFIWVWFYLLLSVLIKKKLKDNINISNSKALNSLEKNKMSLCTVAVSVAVMIFVQNTIFILDVTLVFSLGATRYTASSVCRSLAVLAISSFSLCWLTQRQDHSFVSYCIHYNNIQSIIPKICIYYQKISMKDKN